MENKIQELTDKIYQEGVEKAKAEAQKLIDQAQKEANKIVEGAHTEANSIIKKAEDQSAELLENTKSEIKLFGDQSVNALKSEITDLLVNEVVSKVVQKTTSDKDFFNHFIIELAKAWTSNEDIVISTKDAKSLTDYFSIHAKELLDKGVNIEEVNDIKTHFCVSPKDGSYKINFGDEEFISYFKSFLRPKLISLLFGDN